MLVGIKNVSKLIGISIIACCAVLVCTMFLNFYFDIRLIESEITSELSMFFYNAQVSTAKVSSYQISLSFNQSFVKKIEAFQSVHHVVLILCYTVL